VTVQSKVNLYSKRWLDSFHIPISDARTKREIEFVRAFLPLPAFRKIADVCCGMGRHARALSERGYSVVGVERDPQIIAKAQDMGGGPKYIVADLRNYAPSDGEFDAAIVMGQSFGHFDSRTNQTVLERLVTGLRNGGRIILDVWNPEFFMSHQGERDFELPVGVVRETKRVQNGRLYVRLTYPTGEQEGFEWELFDSAQMESIATALNLTLLASCEDFDCSVKRDASKPRLQFVLECTA
jgi:SAM-dependent methyltransferase